MTQAPLNEDEPDRLADVNINWWKPGWQDIAASIGYRWIVVIVVCGLLLLGVVAGVLFAAPGLLWIGFKLISLLVSVVISVAGYGIRRAVQARNEPFCIFCGYNLNGLPDHYRCPECGRAYTWEQIAEYRRDPHWFIERWKQQRQLPQADDPLISPSTPRRPSRDGT
jgi:hypothetical protein